VFFGIIITIMFFIGAFWRDPPEPEPAPHAVPGRWSKKAALPAAVAALAAAALWPGVAWTLKAPADAQVTVALASPSATNWQGVDDEFWEWRPHVVAADGERYDFFTADGSGPVGLYLGLYLTQRQGAELLNSQNVMVPQKHPRWSDKEQTMRTVRVDGRDMKVGQSRLASYDDRRLLVWYWYRIGGYHTANPYLGKLIEAASVLFSGRRDGGMIVVAAPYADREESAVETMQAFIDDMLPAIDASFDRALRQES
jgi:EpsI family protein